MKKLIVSLLLILSVVAQAATDRNMKMKMELDKSNPNIIIINIVPESEDEYERLKEIIEKNPNKSFAIKIKKYLEKEKSNLNVKEEKNVQKK